MNNCHIAGSMQHTNLLFPLYSALLYMIIILHMTNSVKCELASTESLNEKWSQQTACAYDFECDQMMGTCRSKVKTHLMKVHTAAQQRLQPVTHLCKRLSSSQVVTEAGKLLQQTHSQVSPNWCNLDSMT